MIQEVINNITTAELEAEEIIKIATTKAKDVRLSAEVQAEQIKKSASKESREVVKLMQGNAEVVCVKKMEMRLREGNKEAESYVADCAKKTDEAVDFIVGRLVEKYGNN